MHLLNGAGELRRAAPSRLPSILGFFSHCDRPVALERSGGADRAVTVEKRSGRRAGRLIGRRGRPSISVLWPGPGLWKVPPRSRSLFRGWHYIGQRKNRIRTTLRVGPVPVSRCRPPSSSRPMVHGVLSNRTLSSSLPTIVAMRVVLRSHICPNHRMVGRCCASPAAPFSRPGSRPGRPIDLTPRVLPPPYHATAKTIAGDSAYSVFRLSQHDNSPGSAGADAARQYPAGCAPTAISGYCTGAPMAGQGYMNGQAGRQFSAVRLSDAAAAPASRPACFRPISPRSVSWKRPIFGAKGFARPANSFGIDGALARTIFSKCPVQSRSFSYRLVDARQHSVCSANTLQYLGPWRLGAGIISSRHLSGIFHHDLEELLMRWRDL